MLRGPRGQFVSGCILGYLGAAQAMRSPTLWAGEAVERDQYCDHPVVMPGSSLLRVWTE